MYNYFNAKVTSVGNCRKPKQCTIVFIPKSSQDGYRNRPRYFVKTSDNCWQASVFDCPPGPVVLQLILNVVISKIKNANFFVPSLDALTQKCLFRCSLLYEHFPNLNVFFNHGHISRLFIIFINCD